MRGPHKIIGTLLIAALPLASLASCGSGSETAAALGPLTRAQFIQRTGALCRGVAKEKERKLEELGPAFAGGSRRELEKAVTEVLPLVKEVISKMAALHPPRGDQAAVRLIEIAETTLKQAEANPGRLLRTDPFVRVNVAAAKYGIEGCTF